ncbi:hypothetical protein HHI36_007733 [Cryptolaemus montrouzieri]|uniref:Retrovirus-related Pol polyprotein from transposon TNT 1-94 n=1 Tax=Cryptolaemus montrouzieri TaxID=559131 RepID=A0ABD2MQC1_9CUCU
MNHIFDLTRRLLSCRQSYFNSMEEFVNDVLITLHKLLDLGETIEDKYISVALMNGVDETYETLIMMLTRGKKNAPTSDGIKMAVLEEYGRRKMRQEDSSTAFFSRGNFRKNSWKKKSSEHARKSFVTNAFK